MNTLWKKLSEQANKAYEEQNITLALDLYERGFCITKMMIKDQGSNNPQTAIDFLSCFHFLQEVYNELEMENKAKEVHVNTLKFLAELKNNVDFTASQQETIQYCIKTYWNLLTRQMYRNQFTCKAHSARKRGNHHTIRTYSSQ